MMKLFSKCLALMKDCWDPEFEPSVEDIMDYPMISLWRFFQGRGISLFSRARGR